MKTAKLLATETAKQVYVIRLKLQNDQWAELRFSDRMQARAHYDQIQGTGLIGITPVRSAEFTSENAA
jgi:hypothetical protein